MFLGSSTRQQGEGGGGGERGVRGGKVGRGGELHIAKGVRKRGGVLSVQVVKKQPGERERDLRPRHSTVQSGQTYRVEVIEFPRAEMDYN